MAAALPTLKESGLTLVNEPRRLRVVALFWIAAAAVVYVVDLLNQTHAGLTNGQGRAFGDDFVNYWSGAYLAWHRRLADIFDWNAFHVFQERLVGGGLDQYHYGYPPVLLLLTTPLAFVPFIPGLGLWLLSSWYAFYRALKLAAPEGALLLSLATPALLVNAVGGQNGAWTAALLGGGLMLVDRRPWLAGMLFGLLIYKPHLGVMLPIALLAGRRWQVIIAAGVTVAALIATSLALFGVDMWAGYFGRMTLIRQMILEDGTGVWHRMLSVFVFARRFGINVTWAYALQALVALGAIIVVARSWWRDESPEIRNALAVLGTFLVTPYLQDYDLVVGAFVAVWLWSLQHRGAMAVWPAQAMMIGILLLPLVIASIGKSTGLALGAVVVAVMFALVAAAGSRRLEANAPA